MPTDSVVAAPTAEGELGPRRPSSRLLLAALSLAVAFWVGIAALLLTDSSALPLLLLYYAPLATVAVVALAGARAVNLLRGAKMSAGDWLVAAVTAALTVAMVLVWVAAVLFLANFQPLD